MEERTLRLWQGGIETRVEEGGEGPPLVFLHGPWGLSGDRDFLGLLAANHRVHAPWHPGTSPGNPEAIHRLDDWLDLVAYYGELFDRLGVEAPALVGHSFGGMLACEIAAAMPQRVGRLVLIDPLGLWRADRPVRNWMILPETERARALFADPQDAAAARFFALPADPAERVAAQAGFTWAQACTGKFVWPIPDKGLKKRIHRIATPTLILWGEADAIIAPAYARDFADRIAGAQVAMIASAGHLPQVEQSQETARRVRDFLAGGG
ncbi:MAG TPA: alpha/beta hydrolase [Stellaceae bacterium]|nr:alpha/beta hydrolase [Stellaceae bacterium]